MHQVSEEESNVVKNPSGCVVTLVFMLILGGIVSTLGFVEFVRNPLAASFLWLLLTPLYFLAAWGLWRLKRWAVTLTIVILCADLLIDLIRYGIYSLLIELPLSAYVFYWLITHIGDFSSKPLNKKLRWGITIIVSLFSLFLVVVIVNASLPCYSTLIRGKPLDCSNTDLRGVDLSGANLRGANFTNADLRDANFSGADLTGADFREADLERVNFSGANICNTKFDDQAGPRDKRRFLGECSDQVSIPITSCDEVPNLMKNETVLCVDTRDSTGKGNLWTLLGNNFGIDTIDNYGIIEFEAGTDLYLAFSPPDGKKLTIGLYQNATSKPSQSNPGLHFYAYGWGCDGENGKFEIVEVAYDASEKIERFAASFERLCEGRSTRMTGYIQFNSLD